MLCREAVLLRSPLQDTQRADSIQVEHGPTRPFGLSVANMPDICHFVTQTGMPRPVCLMVSSGCLLSVDNKRHPGTVLPNPSS